MFFPVEEWFAAFMVTLAVEVPVAVLLLRGGTMGVPRLVVLVVLANLATHPSVWFVFTQLFLVGTPTFVIVAEAWAVAVETLFYAVAIAGLSPRRAFTAALVANAASFLAGRLVLQTWLVMAG